MGIFDDSLFGGLFDLNGDGKVDIGEEFMAYKMFEEVTKDDDSDDDINDDFEEEPDD